MVSPALFMLYERFDFRRKGWTHFRLHVVELYEILWDLDCLFPYSKKDMLKLLRRQL